MANGLTDVIRRLEEQRAGIDRALAALREVEGIAGDSGSGAGSGHGRGKQGARKGGMTPEGRRRLSEALKARWAARRAGSSAPAGRSKAKRKGGLTAEGRKRLSESLKKRWAVKRSAAAAAKKAARKAEKAAA